MNDTPLRFERTTDRDVHGDLLLRLGVYRHRCDSYYLAIDESDQAGDTLVDALTRLLDQWLVQLRGLAHGGVALLPFDFSDQCTAWLRVSTSADARAVVEAGWSNVEGWRIQASDYLATAPEITDFVPVANARIECSLEALVRSIQNERDAITAD